MISSAFSHHVSYNYCIISNEIWCQGHHWMTKIIRIHSLVRYVNFCNLLANTGQGQADQNSLWFAVQWAHTHIFLVAKINYLIALLTELTRYWSNSVDNSIIIISHINLKCDKRPWLLLVIENVTQNLQLRGRLHTHHHQREILAGKIFRNSEINDWPINPLWA